MPSPPPVIAIAAPRATLQLEVARTEAQREYGLMNRTSMPLHHGMIFVFDGDSELARRQVGDEFDQVREHAASGTQGIRRNVHP